ncbi:MAG TPA: hypothetical protein VMZ28_09835 [Kofleriaceae bacterium]|nr:hypothetical protein [Kofleriaceae bacterium]
MPQWRIAALAVLSAACTGGGRAPVDRDHPGLRDDAPPDEARADAGPAGATAPGGSASTEPPNEPLASHFRRPPDPVLAAAGAVDPTACGEHTPDACAMRAARLDDATAAAAMAGAACAGGSSLGCSNLAGHLSSAAAGANDPARAVLLYQHACNAGHLAACHKLIYGRAAGCLVARATPCPTQVSPEQARPVVERACKARDHGACTTLAGYLLEAERDRALSLWKDACAAGEPLACHNLADTDPRADGALALHEQACTAGFAASCVKAGLARAVAQHRADGRALVERACALGEPRGCLILDYW